MTSELRNLDPGRAATLAKLCEAIVPGSERVGPVVYIDALMSQMPAAERDAVNGSIDALADAAAGGEPALREHAPCTGVPADQGARGRGVLQRLRRPGRSGPGRV